MTSLRRAFVAVVPPAEVLDAVEAVVGPVRALFPRLSWTHRAQWHLTLQFLGAVDDADVLGESLGESLRRAAPVSLGFGGAGAFPSVSRGSVLWIGLAVGGDEVAALARVVERATEPLGYAPDVREHHPHLTIARSPRPQSVDAVVGAVVDAVVDGRIGPRWDAGVVVLMESDTRTDGAVYSEVARFALGNAKYC